MIRAKLHRWGKYIRDARTGHDQARHKQRVCLDCGLGHKLFWRGFRVYPLSAYSHGKGARWFWSYHVPQCVPIGTSALWYWEDR